MMEMEWAGCWRTAAIEGKHAADTSLVPPSKLRNFGKMDEGIEAYPFLTKLLPAKQERM